MAVAAAGSLFSTQAFAAWSQPTGLADGQQYRILFSTTAKFTNAQQNASTSIGTFNGYVNDAAHSAGAIAYGLPQYTDGTTDGSKGGSVLNWAAMGQTKDGSSARTNLGTSSVNWNNTENGTTILIFNSLGGQITSGTVALFSPSSDHLASGQYSELGTDVMLDPSYRVATGNSTSDGNQTNIAGALGNGGAINRTSPSNTYTLNWFGTTSRTGNSHGFYALSDVLTAHVSGVVPNPQVTLTSANPIRMMLGQTAPIAGSVNNPSPLATAAFTSATLSYGGGSPGGGDATEFVPSGTFDVAIDGSADWTATLVAGWNTQGLNGGGIVKSYNIRASDGTYSATVTGTAQCLDNRAISADPFAAHAHAGFTSPVTLPVTLTGRGPDNVNTMPTVAAATYTTPDTLVSVTGVAGTFSAGSTTHTVNVTLYPGASSGTLNLALASGVGANIVLPEGLPGESINGRNLGGSSNTSVPSDYLYLAYTVYSGQGIWNVDAGGNWSSFSNWTVDGGVPGIDGALSANDTAIFGDALFVGNETVALDVSPSIKALTFDNIYASYELAGPGTLTLVDGTSPVTIDVTGSHVISATVAVPASAGIRKTGPGTLTLSGANSYSGNTTVENGVLSLTAPNLGNSSLLAIGTVADSPAVLDLPIAGTGIVAALVIDGVSQPAGLYDSSNSGGAITGLGKIQVDGDASPYATWIAGASGYFPGVTDPLVVGPTADPDKDGSTNLQEFAFNGNPKDPANNGQIYVLTADSSYDGATGVDAEKELILTVALRKGTGFISSGTIEAMPKTVDGITYTIQGSADLADGFIHQVWVVAPITAPVPALTGPRADEYEYRSFSLDGSNGLPGKGFLRAQVAQP
jgi:autotransporter-associated beta strand protein